MDEDDLNHLGDHREGLAAPDGTAHGPELMFWTLGAWQVRGHSGPGSLLHLRKVHWSSQIRRDERDTRDAMW